MFMDGARANRMQLAEGASSVQGFNNGANNCSLWGIQELELLENLGVTSTGYSGSGYNWERNWRIDGNNNEETKSVVYFKPSVFAGQQEDGTWTEITLSQQTRNGQNVHDGAVEAGYQEFVNDMKNGAYFRFDEDTTIKYVL